MFKEILALSITSVLLLGCGTMPHKKAESLDSVSPEKVYPDLKTAIRNSLKLPVVSYREAQFTFDWRDTLFSTTFGRVPLKKIEFDLPAIKEKSKPKMNDRQRLPEIINPKFFTICSYFSQADRTSVSALVPEVFWIDLKNKATKLEILHFNRNSLTGMHGCLVSTVAIPEGFEKSPQIVIYPKRFDSFVKPIATFQNETMVMAGPVFVPIKGLVTILPDVIGELKIEISDAPKYSDGAKSIEDLL